MSRLGKIPVAIPDKVKVAASGGVINVEGPEGKLSLTVPNLIEVKVEQKEIKITRANDQKQTKSLHGTTRAHLANMVIGASKGFEKILDISGVGFNAQLQGQSLKLIVGFSHPIELPIPQGLKVACPNPTSVVVKGPDKQIVGQFSAQVRGVRPVEPYNLKGIKYRDEVIKKKAGKTFVTGAS